MSNVSGEIRGARQLPLRFEGGGELFVLGVLVLAAALLGIATRPVGLLATFWPANAVIVGLILRSSRGNSVAGWAVCAAGLVAADLLTGADLGKTLILNGANMVSAAAAMLVLARFARSVIEMRAPSSVPALVLASVAGGVAGGLCGMIANPLLFDGSPGEGFRYWSVTELANYLSVLPVILSAPRAAELVRRLRLPDWRDSVPFAVLLMSVLACLLVGGPGTIVFLLPALLWCASSYSVFVTAILTALCSFLALSIFVTSYLPLAEQSPAFSSVISFRLGVSFIALSAIMLAVKSAMTRQLLARLGDIANRDGLTGVNNRRSFLARAGSLLNDMPAPSVVLMLDIDNFKRINDGFGHANGDRVLQEFCARVERCLRQSDLVGRMGGEEFCVLLHHCGQRQGRGIAERIRRSVSDAMVKLDDGVSIRMTVSIGLVTTGEGQSLTELLKRADAALYAAKKAGRNRVVGHAADERG